MSKEKKTQKNPNISKLSELSVDDNSELVQWTIELARAMRKDKAIWAIFERVSDELEFSEEESGLIDVFEAEFFRLKNIKRPLDSSLSRQVLRQTAAKKYSAVDDDLAKEYLRAQCKFW